MARLLNCVAQQHKSPCQAKYQQQHTQLLWHVLPQECSQHDTVAGKGGRELQGLGVFSKMWINWRILTKQRVVYSDKEIPFSAVCIHREVRVEILYKASLVWSGCTQDISSRTCACLILIQPKEFHWALRHPATSTRRWERVEQQKKPGSGNGRRLTPVDTGS